MEKLTPETLTLIIVAIMLINAVLLVAFLIQKIMAKRYRNIALKWAQIALDYVELIDNPKGAFRVTLEEMKKEYNEDFELSSTYAKDSVDATKIAMTNIFKRIIYGIKLITLLVLFTLLFMTFIPLIMWLITGIQPLNKPFNEAFNKTFKQISDLSITPNE
ncbi:hypothetical protein [Roseivirga seohaensis]|uniref:hypothetical protein n=1 Tax=Roseivirga seohaensis TaxID=1914963 RepID=UPI003BAAE6B8